MPPASSPCAVESGQDIGSAAWLEQHYEQPQRRRNGAMVAAIDGMSSMFGPQVSAVHCVIDFWSLLLGDRATRLASGAHFKPSYALCGRVTTACRLAVLPPCWGCGMQAGPVAGMRSLGLDVINSSPVLKHTILRIAMHGL